MTEFLRYRLNTPRVVHERFDDEWVLVNFETGVYYSVGPLGAEIVELIQAGHDAASTAAIVATRYAGEPASIEQSVRRLVDQMVLERLLVPNQDGASLTPVLPIPPSTHRPAFVAPTLEKFTDMQDLLLFDPIHEVDESGWPLRAGTKPDDVAR